MPGCVIVRVDGDLQDAEVSENAMVAWMGEFAFLKEIDHIELFGLHQTEQSNDVNDVVSQLCGYTTYGEVLIGGLRGGLMVIDFKKEDLMCILMTQLEVDPEKRERDEEEKEYTENLKAEEDALYDRMDQTDSP